MQVLLLFLTMYEYYFVNNALTDFINLRYFPVRCKSNSAVHF